MEQIEGNIRKNPLFFKDTFLIILIKMTHRKKYVTDVLAKIITFQSELNLAETWQLTRTQEFIDGTEFFHFRNSDAIFMFSC